MPTLSVKSAGIDSGAVTPLSTELVAWADLIFVLEAKHSHKLITKFGAVARLQVVGVITRINYHTQKVYILHILTYAEYDKGDWK